MFHLCRVTLTTCEKALSLGGKHFACIHLKINKYVKLLMAPAGSQVCRTQVWEWQCASARRFRVLHKAETAWYLEYISVGALDAQLVNFFC